MLQIFLKQFYRIQNHDINEKNRINILKYIKNSLQQICKKKKRKDKQNWIQVTNCKDA